MFKQKLWLTLALLLSPLLMLAAGLPAAPDLAARALARSPARSTAANSTVFLPAVLRIVPALRIDSGASADYSDAAGRTWVADTGFIGGQAGDSGSIAIAGTSDPRIYQTERFKLTGYTLPVANGTYTVTLHFAENFYTGAGKRVFSINVEGTPISNLDIFAEAGGAHIALKKTVVATVADGQLDLAFTPSVAETTIDGIEVVPPNAP